MLALDVNSKYVRIGACVNLKLPLVLDAVSMRLSSHLDVLCQRTTMSLNGGYTFMFVDCSELRHFGLGRKGRTFVLEYSLGRA